MKIKLIKVRSLVGERLLFIMKTFIFLFCTTVFSFTTEKSFSQDKIKIDADKIVTVDEVFNIIQSQTNFRFLYPDNLFENASKVQLRKGTIEVSKLLERSFSESKSNVKFKFFEKNTIVVEEIELISKPKTEKPQQPIQISGKVTDKDGQPIPGVNLLEKGVLNGTQTDFDGKFIMSVSNKNAILVVSYLGFTTQEVPLNGQTSIAVTLIESTTTLSEIVVIGYGSQKKAKISGSIATVSISELQDFPVSNFDQALAGKLAGVQILQTTGEPGRELSIKVRGTKTLTAGASPLYVIDGVPIETGDRATEAVNMEDIESIQVLKDAASAAIYGSRGSNGIVIITTKKGKNGVMKVSLDHSTGIQNVSKKIDMMDAYQYAQLSKDGHDAAYLQEIPTGTADDPNGLRPVGYHKIPEELFPYLNGVQGLTNTDWQDEIFRPAVIQRYNLSVSGGNDQWNYFVSTNHSFQEGIVIESDYKKTGLRANVSINSGKFKIGVNTSSTYTFENRVNASGPYTDDGIVASALGMSPTWSVYKPDGSYNFDGNGLWRIGTDYQHNEILNPVAVAKEIQNEVEHYNVLANLFVEYEMIKDLKLKTSLAANYNNYQNEYFEPSIIEKRGLQNYGQLDNNNASLSTTTIYKWTFENTINYNKKVGLHNFEILGGMTAEKSSSRNQRITNFLPPSIPGSNATQIINAGNADIDYGDLTDPNDDRSIISVNATSGLDEWSLFSLLARFQYDYDGKYLLSASIRRDGSSRFAPNSKYGNFPSASAGWRISQEEFLKNKNWIDELKIRGSYGVTGNFEIPNYAFLPLLGGEDYLGASGLKPNNIPNDKLSWETTTMYNIGIDAELFKRQLGFSVEYYNGDTTDLLLNLPVPQTTGFGTFLQNIGKVNNRGYELGLKIAPDLGQLKWTSNFNISFNTNEVLELGPEGTPIEQIVEGVDSAFFRTEIGQPIGNYYLLVQDGVFISQDKLNKYPHFPNTAVGDFRFVDVDKDGFLDVNKDRTIVGNYAPDFTYGFSNSFKYKGFDLNIAYQGSHGGEVLNLLRRYSANSEGNFNNTTEMLNRYQSPINPGDGNTNRANRKSQGNNSRISTWHVEDGSYLRLQNVSLGYSLPKSVLEKLNFDKIRIYATGNNIYTWTRFTGYNPEVNKNSGTQLTPGVDYGTYPLATTYSLGINLSF